MKVKELIALLQQIDPDAEVLVSTPTLRVVAVPFSPGGMVYEDGTSICDNVELATEPLDPLKPWDWAFKHPRGLKLGFKGDTKDIKRIFQRDAT